MHVFRAGESKSAVEPYLRDDMAENEREIVTRWLGGLWSAYTELAETGRELPEGDMDRFIASFGERLTASKNNLADTMLAGGWVDALADHAEMEAALVEWVGATNENGDAEQRKTTPWYVLHVLRVNTGLRARMERLGQEQAQTQKQKRA